MKSQDGLTLIEDYNVDRLTFDWGGQELLPRREFMLALDMTDERYNILLERVEDMESITEGIDYFLLEKSDMLGIVHPDRKFVFEGMGEDALEPCITKPLAASIIAHHIEAILKRLYSPFEELSTPRKDFH